MSAVRLMTWAEARRLRTDGLRRPGGRLMCVAATLALVATGCGDDDGGTDDAAERTTSTSVGTASETHDVVASDYSFSGLPAEIRVGDSLSLRNSSAAEAHELVAFDLPASEERSAAELFALPYEELSAFFAGDPTVVLVAAPGEESFATLGDGSLTLASRYIVFCAVPTGADPAEYVRQSRESTLAPPQVDGGPPHFTEGMYGELTVVE